MCLGLYTFETEGFGTAVSYIPATRFGIDILLRCQLRCIPVRREGFFSRTQSRDLYLLPRILFAGLCSGSSFDTRRGRRTSLPGDEDDGST